MPTKSQLSAVVCISLAAATTCIAEDPSHLFRCLPGSANTIVVIDVKAVRGFSGRSVGADATGYEIIAGAPVSPAVDTILYATHLEPSKLETRRTSGVFRLNRPVALSDVAEKTNGKMITIHGSQVVSSPRHGYLVELTPNTLGMARQINLQELARWISFACSNQENALPKYLRAALQGNQAPIIVAVDLEDMFDASVVRQRLSASNVAASAKDDVDAVAKMLGGIKGIVLSVSGKDLDNAELRIDLGGAAGSRGDLIKALFLETLDDFGASLPDFRKAVVTAEGSTVRLTAKLSDDGLIRVMSMFMPPTPVGKSSQQPKLQSNGVSLEATHRYFQSIQTLLSELQRKGNRSADYLATATWHETYSKRIEELPFRYVDQDVVKYGNETAKKLRTIAYSLRGVIVEVNALETGVTSVSYNVGWWWGGPRIQVDTNLSQLRTRQAEIVRRDASRRLGIWESIDEEQRTVVKTIRDRYGFSID